MDVFSTRRDLNSAACVAWAGFIGQGERQSGLGARAVGERLELSSGFGQNPESRNLVDPDLCDTMGSAESHPGTWQRDAGSFQPESGSQ
jgi:hypothetical protein